MGNFDRHYFNDYSDRTRDFARGAADNIRALVAQDAGKWLETGAKLGALKGGARVAGGFVRRNPVVIAATAAGVGLLWYAAWRKANQKPLLAIEGRSKRVQARRRTGAARPRRRSGAQPATAVKTPSSDD